MENNLIIRKFKPADKPDLRRIACATAFMGEPCSVFFDDDEVLADALTLYFTDYEPDSCFVAEANTKVIGYLTGARDIKVMEKIMERKIAPRLAAKAASRGFFCKIKNLRFLWYCALSFIKGDFAMPDFTKDYPATFHINIDQEFRGQGIGRKLLEGYLGYLKENGVCAVQCATLSLGGRDFFKSAGFAVLFAGRRSYLEHYPTKNNTCYVLGKLLCQK